MSTHTKNPRITNEHAIFFEEVPGCPLIDYVKAVASVIGSSNIDSIVQKDNKIKLFLKEKQHVDYIIGSGIVVKSQHAKVEYAQPPVAHVLVLNLDLIVPDDYVVAALSPFGCFKSNVIRPTLSQDSAYCHILSGERRVYMKLFDRVKLPASLSIEYNGETFDMSLKVEAPSPQIAEVKPKIACVSSVQGGSYHTTTQSKDSESPMVPVKTIKIEYEEPSENDDDMFELFSGVNDWDSLLSDSNVDQAKSHDKVSIKPKVNVCSVKPMQSSRLTRGLRSNSH